MYEWEIELTVRLLDLAFSGGWLQKDSTLFEILLYLHQHTLTIKQMDVTIKQVDMLTVILKSFYGFSHTKTLHLPRNSATLHNHSIAYRNQCVRKKTG